MENFSPLPESVLVTLVIDGTPLNIEIEGPNAPNTGGNFVDLVEKGFYDGIVFHRVVDNFVIQAGDPTSLSEGTAAKEPVTRTIPLEIRESTSGQFAFGFTFAQAGIPDAVPTLQNTRGTIAMARSGNPNDPANDTPNTASTQFYINLSDANTFLDGNYAVFGRVQSNVDFIDTVRQGESIVTGARVTNGTVPSRTSGFMTSDALNFFANQIGRATLNISFQTFSQEGDTLALTPELSGQNPTGFLTFGGNDTVTGSSINDVIYTGRGADSVTGGGGSDLIRGGRDNDTLSGESGNDIIHGNLGDDVLTGGSDNDFIRGGRGNDSIFGGAGNDFLVGDRDTDTLTGGTGADTFILRTASDLSTDASVVDTIADFSSAEGDRIVISGEVDASTVSFVASGADALVQIAGVGFVGRVANGASLALSNSVTVVGSGDLGVSFG
ncbi:MAG: peptidylprolyl isomerase [Geitlerinemataceae cyanobacterium]